jgi:hypothetical protein
MCYFEGLFNAVISLNIPSGFQYGLQLQLSCFHDFCYLGTVCSNLILCQCNELFLKAFQCSNLFKYIPKGMTICVLSRPYGNCHNFTTSDIYSTDNCIEKPFKNTILHCMA